jgi:enoyl-[acyl-carrier-protein] reductase (NADH)
MPRSAALGYGAPEEFGQVAGFVLSPVDSCLTGALIPVDGGASPWPLEI